MTAYRERKRDPDAQRAVQLARELARLAAEFPRFRLALNRLRHHVLLQVRAPGWKTGAVLKCLDQREPTSVRAISKLSGLDHVSATRTLAELHGAERVLACTRGGQLVVDHERATYWLKK